jgi:hypothetical protein
MHARRSQRAVGFEDTPRLPKPPDVPLKVLLEAPIERIESLRSPTLRFRVLLRDDGANKLKSVR